MKNTFKLLGIIAMLAVIGLALSCEVAPEDQTMITIQNIPTSLNGKYATVGLYDDAKKLVAFAVPKPISGGKVTNLEMLNASDNKAFGKNDSYYIGLEINTKQDLTGDKLYNGQTTSKKSVSKGEVILDTEVFYPDIFLTYAPEKTFFGTYKTTYNTSGGGTQDEYIDFSEDKFKIYEDDVTDDDFLEFKIDDWDEAITPAELKDKYPNAYRFRGVITDAKPKSTSEIYGPATAPNLTSADLNKTVCEMYIYVKNTDGVFTFVRTRFIKDATSDKTVVTGSGGSDRIYTLQE